MDGAGGTKTVKKGRSKSRAQEEDDGDTEEEVWDSDSDDETIARIQRAHYAQAAAMNSRRRAAPKKKPMSNKRKLEAVKTFHDFTKKLKQDTGISIRGLVGNNILDMNSDYSSETTESDSDGLSEEEFVVNPTAVEELNNEDESYIDPETGDIVQAKSKAVETPIEPAPSIEVQPELPKTLSISDIINEGDLDLTKNVEIAEVEGSELCPESTPAEDLLDMKQEESSQDFDITEKLKEMGEISVKPLDKEGEEDDELEEGEKNAETDEEKKPANPNALNVRRNIREVMDEKNLDASTLTAQRQESERLARVQEQQRIIREVQRQIALNRQNKIHQKTLSLLQGGSSILKKTGSGQKLNLPNTVISKLPSTEKPTKSQLEISKVAKPTTSGAGQRKEIVEIVDIDSSSGEESSSSSSDSDDCIMLSDSEVPPSPEAEEDPNNSGLHVNDAYNLPDEQGRVQINIGHPENEEDIFLAPQIARVIKPHQIGGVRFLFDNIIESVERFSTSSGFGCILAHSMGLGKTLQIVCFCDIFLRHTTSKTVLCIMPINTLQNWVAEFNMWLPVDPNTSSLGAHGEVRPRNFPIYVLNDSHKTLQMRAKVVKDWTLTGGVLMIGYELYRLLSMKKDKKPRKKKKAELRAEEREREEKKAAEAGNDDTQNSDITNLSKNSEESKEKEDDFQVRTDDRDAMNENSPADEDKKLLNEMYAALVKPGPDLVICDEGHRIKNSHSNISYALKQMRTKRRVVLTGYPLQNNLLEYWCMVDFVRPNYLGSKTEFCNMFERPIQNGQCIDSTPQDIRLMRYRAHVLHSLLVGFVQRRSHAVLQSTLPQKEEYVLLIRMTPLQRKLYDRFMNEVVRSTAVPNPLKAFAICCKIWNHPDVLYNFLRKRSEANALIEEDLDLEEIGGITKARARNKQGGIRQKPGPKPRGGPKKPAATIPPNTSTGSVVPRQDANFGNPSYPPNGPYGPNAYRPDQPGGYPPYPNYQNPPGYYPPNQGYNQNYDSNYYQQQSGYNNYPNQYPQNNEGQGYNQNYWGGNNYYGQGNQSYYNNPQYPNNQPPQDYRASPAEFNNQQYPPNYNAPPTEAPYPSNAAQPYQGQEGYGNQRPPYQGFNQPGYPDYNPNAPTTYPNNPPNPEYPNQPYPPPYNNPAPYAPNATQYNQYDQKYPGFSNNMPPNSNVPNQTIKTEPRYPNEIKTEPNLPQIMPPVGHNALPNISQTMPNPAQHSVPPMQQNAPAAYGSQPFGYPPNAPAFPNSQENANSANYPTPYSNIPRHLETKPPLGSAGSGSPITSWPITELKTEVDRFKAEEKAEVKSESDGEVKIADLDTKTIVKDESKKAFPFQTAPPKVTLPEPAKATEKDTKEATKSDESESEETPKKKRGRKKGSKNKNPPKPKAKGRKDRKTSKEKNNEDGSESEESEKEEKLNREEQLALVKKAEEMTYDWASELLKDYIPGIIENSAKMEFFFYILNESIKLGDRLLLFSQSLFTLNLIEEFLARNYIPGTHCPWERNTNYYRLDGSTHALEREKLINEFNANPHIYLFLVSTRAGSLGINLVGANRVIVFDASWNPCHDTQAVCRVYRYGQKKPCFVYRFVMDCCLEKKIYDRQINKQGMADRVVDECNPDAVLSMKEITNLCFDNDDKDSEIKDLSSFKDKYLDVLMQGVITYHAKWLSKEPFQHESLLVDRKEKKLSSAEKRLAQRGYELEKKAALAPKPTTAYRTVRTADGSIVQRPVGTVRPMQHGARWIPADVWRRQGMTAQEMTLPLDVVIPTNSAEKTNIVLKAGQRVMVLKSPKGIYMQLESGKIIAIKTSFKGDPKDSPIGKKVLGTRPSPANIPGSLKNNSAITITSKTGPRPNIQRLMARPGMMGSNKMRPLMPGQKINHMRQRIGEFKSINAMRARPSMQGRGIRSLQGSLSITKIPRAPKADAESANKTDGNTDDETQVLDSEDEGTRAQDTSRTAPSEANTSENRTTNPNDSTETENSNDSTRPNKNESLILTTDEKLPSEEALERKSVEETSIDFTRSRDPSLEPPTDCTNSLSADRIEKKINLLKNYRHQRHGNRPPTESSLSQLERTASVLNKEGMPDFRRNLDDITQSYSPTNEEKNMKSKKKKSPSKAEGSESQDKPMPSMSHSVSSLLGPSGSTRKVDIAQNMAPVASLENPGLRTPLGLSHEPPMGIPPTLIQPSKPQSHLSMNMSHGIGQNMAPVASIENPGLRTPLGLSHEPPMGIPPTLIQPTKPQSHLSMNMSHGIGQNMAPVASIENPGLRTPLGLSHEPPMGIPPTLIQPTKPQSHLSMNMSHGIGQNMAPVASIENPGLRTPLGLSHEAPMGIPPTLIQPSKPQSHMSLNMSHGTLLRAGSPTPAGAEVPAPVPGMPIPHPHPSSAVPPHAHPLAAPSQPYPPVNPPPDGYGQYPPGYGMGYGAYPNPAYYGGYGGAGYYPPYSAPPGPTAPYAPPAPGPAPAPAPAHASEGYMPPNPQW